jgi:hypothetical protein
MSKAKTFSLSGATGKAERSVFLSSLKSLSNLASLFLLAFELQDNCSKTPGDGS